MIIKPHFNSIEDEFNGLGKRPVIFDIIAPDGFTSLLPDNLKMVLYTNPKDLNFSYSKKVERSQSR